MFDFRLFFVPRCLFNEYRQLDRLNYFDSNINFLDYFLRIMLIS